MLTGGRGRELVAARWAEVGTNQSKKAESG